MFLTVCCCCLDVSMTMVMVDAGAKETNINHTDALEFSFEFF